MHIINKYTFGTRAEQIREYSERKIIINITIQFQSINFSFNNITKTKEFITYDL